MSDINEITCSAQELAAILGLTPARVHQLASDQIISKPDRNSFNLSASVLAYCKFIRGAARGSHSTQEEKIHRNKLLKAKAEMAAMESAKMAGDLVSAEAIRKQDFQIARILRNNLMSIPDRTATMLAAESDAHKVHTMIEQEVVNCLNAIIEAMAAEEVDEATLDITRRDSADHLLTDEEKTDDDEQHEKDIQTSDPGPA
jgi:phage terminase Nu1 subunit (DNA packaging protein)